jgi:hypothetical protein
MGQEYDGLHSFAYYSEPPRNGNSGTPTPPHAAPELALGWARLRFRKKERKKERGKEKEDRKTERRKERKKERKKGRKKALGSQALLPSFPCFVGFSRFCALPPLASERASKLASAAAMCDEGPERRRMMVRDDGLV